MILKNDAKFEETLTPGSKNDMRNLVNFNAKSCKSENLHFDVLLLSKVYYVWCKIWGVTDFSFKKWHKKFDEFDPTLRSLNICTLIGSFWLKYIMFELKN